MMQYHVPCSHALHDIRCNTCHGLPLMISEHVSSRYVGCVTHQQVPGVRLLVLHKAHDAGRAGANHLDLDVHVKVHTCTTISALPESRLQRPLGDQESRRQWKSVSKLSYTQSHARDQCLQRQTFSLFRPQHAPCEFKAPESGSSYSVLNSRS